MSPFIIAAMVIIAIFIVLSLVLVGFAIYARSNRLDDDHIDEHVADIPRVPPQIDFRNTNFFRD